MKTKTLRWFNVILLTSLLGLGLGSCGGSSSGSDPGGNNDVVATYDTSNWDDGSVWGP